MAKAVTLNFANTSENLDYGVLSPQICLPAKGSVL